MTLVRKGLWPARPSLCLVLEMVRGHPTCNTRSISPTSIPSSIDEVAHKSRSLPSLSAFSVSSLCPLERLP